MASETSFDALRAIQMSERHSPALVKLEDDFYPRYVAWLAELEAHVKKQFTLEGVQTLENARRALMDLFELRKQKLFFKARKDFRKGAVSSTGLSGQEKELYTGLITLLSQYQLALAPQPSPSDEDVAVEVLADVPAFVGFDAQTYGPLKAGQHARLPRRQADFLSRKGVLKVIQ